MNRKYDPFDLPDYLDESERFQTFRYAPLNPELQNAYTGLDQLQISSIQDDHIYALIHDGNIAQIENGEPVSVSYFFDQATYDKFVDPTTGEFDACALSEALQLDPGGYSNYRDSIACFDVHPEKLPDGDLKLPTGTCTANTQFGGGGGHQAFAPKDVSADLQSSGVLQVNPDRSNFHTGTNTEVTPEKQDMVDHGVEERQKNCLQNMTPHHDTSVDYPHGFTPTPNLVGGEAFQSNGNTHQTAAEASTPTTNPGLSAAGPPAAPQTVGSGPGQGGVYRGPGNYNMIDPHEIQDINSLGDNFWNHHGNTKEDYMNLASKLPEVQEQLASGKTLDEIKQNPELHDTAAAYYNPDKMIHVYQDENGYHFEDDGRHRLEAAKEVGCDVPVRVSGMEEAQNAGPQNEGAASVADNTAGPDESGRDIENGSNTPSSEGVGVPEGSEPKEGASVESNPAEDAPMLPGVGGEEEQAPDEEAPMLPGVGGEEEQAPDEDAPMLPGVGGEEETPEEEPQEEPEEAPEETPEEEPENSSITKWT